jgi:hypothetical protein
MIACAEFSDLPQTGMGMTKAIMLLLTALQ